MFETAAENLFMILRSKKLAIVGGRACSLDSKLYASASFGKIVEEFASRYSHIYLSSPLQTDAFPDEDYILPSNLTIAGQPNWKTATESMKHLRAIRRSYKYIIDKADHVFIRGNPVPATSFLYAYCAKNEKPVCHWIVGNPIGLLKSHKRDGFVRDMLGRLYIWLWEKKLLHGRHLANGTFLCNGQELADRYPTAKTLTIVSTTLTKKDYYLRKDTCAGEEIVLLCLCYMRPEKGIEYLIEAVRNLKVNKKVKLVLAGSRDRYPRYQSRLDDMVKNFKMEQDIKFFGHVRNNEIHDLMLRSDIFVLPTLSEGTPRVIVEARAKCLPVVTTNVGGIPTSMTNGYDGVLVPSKDSKSLRDAIHHIIHDSDLRKRIIRNGYATAKKLTVDKFVDRAIECF